MNYDDVLIGLNVLIDRLDSIMDIMFESTKEVIDIGNVNYELKNVISKLDMIIDSLEDSNQKSMLATVKDNISYATVDIIDNADIFDKINRLGDAKGTMINVKEKLYMDGHL